MAAAEALTEADSKTPVRIRINPSDKYLHVEWEL